MGGPTVNIDLAIRHRLEGPVFEMGCGDYSTPVLHAILEKQQRALLSRYLQKFVFQILISSISPMISKSTSCSDTDKMWLNKFRHLESSWHTFEYVQVLALFNNYNPSSWRVLEHNIMVIFIVARYTMTILNWTRNHLNGTTSELVWTGVSCSSTTDRGKDEGSTLNAFETSLT